VILWAINHPALFIFKKEAPEVEESQLAHYFFDFVV